MDHVTSSECLKLDSQSEVLEKNGVGKDLFSQVMVPLNCNTPIIGECKYCLNVGNHYTPLCPYKYHLPKNATLGSGCEVICKICGCLFRGFYCVGCGLSERQAILKDCSIFGKQGWKVVDTSEGVDPSSLATKVDGSVKARETAAPASLDTVQELAKETGSSEEQIQAQNGLDDALKRRLQKLIDSVRVMLFMKGTPEEPKCRFSKMAVNILKYSNWSLLPQIYFEGRARGFRHIGTLMKGCPSESTGENIFY